MSIFDFFKKKATPEGLEKAKALGLITEEEFLKIEIWRAEEKLKQLKDPKKKRRT